MSDLLKEFPGPGEILICVTIEQAFQLACLKAREQLDSVLCEACHDADMDARRELLGVCNGC